MGLKLIAGRWFDADRPADDMTLPTRQDRASKRRIAERGVNVVINEYAAKKLGFESPQDAVGKVVKSELLVDDFGAGEHHHHRRRRRFALPLGPHADRADHVPQGPDRRRAG